MISRTLSRTPTLATFSVKYGVSFGRKCRDALARCGHYLKPLRKYLFRNFLIVHYFYILSMTILTSILLYPVRNIRYIDILFISTGATTQGGLNTVNMNEMKLYQQIVIYIITFLTTPIAIHGTLAFVRLYWFERHFDGIRDFSKRYYKMRRTKTILGRELTARTMSRSHPHRVNTRQMSTHSYRNDNFQEKLFSGKLLNRDEQDSLTGLSHDANAQRRANVSDGPSRSSTMEDTSYVRPSGRGLLFKEPKPRRHLQKNGNDIDNNREPTAPPESFARRRRSTDISPEDMYRSLTMMKDQRQRNAEDEGPALVIGAPAERTKSKNRARSNLKGDVSSPIKQISSYKHPTAFQKETVDNENDDEDQIKKENGSTRGTESNTHSEADSNPSLPSSRTENSGDIDTENDSADAESNTYSEADSNPSLSSSRTENSGGIGTENSSSNVSTNNIVATDSMNDLSVSSSNVVKNGHRGTASDTNDIPSSQSQHGHSQENRNGPSIHFDVAPSKRKRARNYRTPTGKKVRRHHRFRGKNMPRSRSIGQRLKRRLSLGNMERRPTNVANDRIAMNNLDDYFADDENDREIDQGSKEGTSNDFPRANTLEHQHGSPEENNYLEMLGKSQSFDVGKSRDWNKLSASPEFQKMIYENWKKRNKGKGRTLRSRLASAPTIPGFRTHYHDRDDDNDIADVPIDQNQYGYPDNFEGSDRGESMDGRNSLDEEAGYFGNDLTFANTTDDPPRTKLSRTLSTNYLSWEPTIGRNSVFINLTKEQKEELGGVEYRAIKILCRILVGYYGGFWVMIFVFLVPWIVCRDTYRKIVRSDHVAPAWWGFFTGMSAFCDLGLTLTPDSMNSFRTTSYPTIIMMFFIVIGNTGFPVLLRFIIWVMFQLSPDLSLTRESLAFLLDHPRRCFTMLFPSAATWWLLVSLIGLNAIDLIIFVILDLGDPLLHSISRGYRVLAGLFQAICTRTAGFEIVDISNIHPAVQISYMVMMYVSVMPMAISIRRTNVYEEGSLGIYAPDENTENIEPSATSDQENTASASSGSHSGRKKKKKNKKNKKKNKKHRATSFIAAHLRRQLSFDLWFMFLGIFIICLAEGGKIRDKRRPDFNLFAIIFETVSAYGTVGMSLGYPNTDTSFSAQFTTISKLVIIALLIRGRHRGLPYTLDRAIILPSDKLDNMDKLQDLRMRDRVRHETTGDPVAAYFKSKVNAIKRGLRALRTKAIEEEEDLIEDFRELPHYINGEQTDSYEDTSDDESDTDDVNTSDHGDSSHAVQHDDGDGNTPAESKETSNSPQSTSLNGDGNTPAESKETSNSPQSTSLNAQHSSYPAGSLPSSRISPFDCSDMTRMPTGPSTEDEYRIKPTDSVNTT